GVRSQGRIGTMRKGGSFTAGGAVAPAASASPSALRSGTVTDTARGRYRPAGSTIWIRCVAGTRSTKPWTLVLSWKNGARRVGGGRARGGGIGLWGGGKGWAMGGGGGGEKLGRGGWGGRGPAPR